VRVFVLGSGSLGNAVLVDAGGTRVVVDCGVGPRAAHEKMCEMGEPLFPRGADGIVITHAHDDHAAKLGPFARATRAPVWLHDGIDLPRARRKLPVRRYDTQRPFRIGAVVVDAFEIPHDAPQVALRLSEGDRSVAVVTDLGHIPRGLDRFLGACDEIFLESNYCPEQLAIGPYPHSVRRRVSGPEGHLSNEDAAELVARLEGTRVSRVHLCHISENNNTPERALEVVRARANRIEVDAIRRACVFEITPAPRTSNTFVQLGLFG